jgi:hypothetical protein
MIAIFQLIASLLLACGIIRLVDELVYQTWSFMNRRALMSRQKRIACELELDSLS